jgi:hypothetical protein
MQCTLQFFFSSSLSKIQNNGCESEVNSTKKKGKNWGKGQMVCMKKKRGR